MSETKKRRKLCELGTGEVVHVLNYKSLPEKIEEFERIVQVIAHDLYQTTTSVTDVRVCHPKCGEICFIITFLTKADLGLFENGPQQDFEANLKGLVETNDGKPSFSSSGCLMPAAHSLESLIEYLKANVLGTNHTEHDVPRIKKELAKWYPRSCEYSKYIAWNKNDPKKYTRNLVFRNDNMEVILMCWPARSQSTIHDHDKSSCWVMMVEGVVHEVQFALPTLDKKFIETEMKNPTGATGRCGALRVISDSKLEAGGITATYANNEIGIHRVENRTDEPAYTLHVYAPPLERFKIFSETGEVRVVVNSAASNSSCLDGRSDVFFDVNAWNEDRYTQMMANNSFNITANAR